MSDTTMSLNEQVMRALHPTWVKMGGYFNDGEGHGYMTPDFEHSTDTSLAVLPEECAVEIWQARDWLAPHENYRARIVPIPLTYTNAIGVIDFKGHGATRAEALARATLAWAQRQEG